MSDATDSTVLPAPRLARGDRVHGTVTPRCPTAASGYVEGYDPHNGNAMVRHDSGAICGWTSADWFWREDA